VVVKIYIITTKVATSNLTPCINKMYKKGKKEGKNKKKEGDERNKIPCIFSTSLNSLHKLLL
jgi:hypothetical protein